MSLSDSRVRAAKPRAKNYKIYDSEGLFLLVTPAGGRLWRVKYRYDGKEKLLAVGAYPIVGLAAARQKRDAALRVLDAGKDPSAEKAQQKRAVRDAASNTFEIVGREWHAAQKHRWTPAYGRQVMVRLEVDVFPDLGQRPIAEIEPKEVLTTLKTVEDRGVLETTRRLKQYCSSIFRFGIASDYCRHDPATLLKGALKAPPRAVHHLALPRDAIGEFLIRLPTYDGEAATRIAIHLALLTVVRTKELRAAEWSEFEKMDEPDHALWRIPAVRMKMREEHLVPLSRQAVAAISGLPGSNERKGVLFPSGAKDGVMSNNTMLYGLYRLGYHGRTTTHGFRRLFSTEANEHEFDENWIERQLAHDERDEVRGAYNSAQYLPQRRKMLQWWADYLDELRVKEEARLRAEAERVRS